MVVAGDLKETYLMHYCPRIFVTYDRMREICESIALKNGIWVLSCSLIWVALFPIPGMKGPWEIWSGISTPCATQQPPSFYSFFRCCSRRKTHTQVVEQLVGLREQARKLKLAFWSVLCEVISPCPATEHVFLRNRGNFEQTLKGRLEAWTECGQRDSLPSKDKQQMATKDLVLGSLRLALLPTQ